MSAGGVVGQIVVELARWLIAAGHAEATAALADYWRSRNLGPIPPPLDRWASIDRAHDERVRRRKAREGDADEVLGARVYTEAQVLHAARRLGHARAGVEVLAALAEEQT